MADDSSSLRIMAGSASLADLVDAARSADPENPCDIKLGALIWGASRLGDVELLGQLLRMHSDTILGPTVQNSPAATLTWAPKEGPERGLSSLCAAAKYGHVEVVRMLLEAEAPRTWPNTSHNAFALGFAASQGHSDVVRLLLDAGMKPDTSMDLAFPVSTSLQLAIQGRHEGVVEQLLAAGASADRASGSEEETPLHVAARILHEGFVVALLKAGANPNRPNASGETPLLLAAGSSKGSRDAPRAVIARLLDAGAKLVTSSLAGLSTLHAFAGLGDDDRVERLISSGAAVNQVRTPQCDTPLHCAAENGHDVVVQRLLKAGANVNVADWNDETPLHRACKNCHLEVVKRLMEANADIFSTNAAESPVELAAAEGNVAILEQLIFTGEYKEEGIDNVPIRREGFEDEDVLGEALVLAGEIGHANVIRFLSDSGVDINYQDASGDTALMRAAVNGHHHVIYMMLNAFPHADLYLANYYDIHTAFYSALHNGHEDIVELFMESLSFDINRANSIQGTTPLHVAVDEDNDALVERLLSLKAVPDLPDEYDGETALIQCLKYHKHKSVLLKLLKGGADPNKGNDDTGEMPLMFAAENDDQGACNALIEAGADVDYEHPDDSLTALEIAVDSDSKDAALLLLRRGASKMNNLSTVGINKLLAWQAREAGDLEYRLHMKEEQLQHESRYLSQQVEAWCEGVVNRERRRIDAKSREKVLQKIPAE